MFLPKITVLLSALFVGCLAVSANNLVERQDEGHFTYTVTCVGPRCSDSPGWPRPTSTGQSTLKTSSTKKVSSTSKKTTSSTKYTTPPPDTPTKTTKTSPPTKTQTEEVGPSSTRCPVPLYYQCGGYYDGKPWTGCTKCVSGAKCIWQNDFYYQCVADD